MKLFLVAAILALASATFVDFLTQLQGHHSFQRLSAEEKLLFGELVVAAENDELTQFIDRAGFTDVLKLMDHMSSYDAELFAAYLAEHSNYTHHANGHENVINKREDNDEHRHHNSLWDYLNSASSHANYNHLPAAEKATADGLRKAVQNHQLTAYVDQVGYGAVFGLLEQLDGDNLNTALHNLERALEAEAAQAVSVGKRQGNSHHGSHQGFYDYFASLKERYYAGLPAQEKQTYDDIMKAIETKTLTAYIDTAGYGPIFGFLEHLDSYHANRFYDELTNALESEAAAAAAAASSA